MSLVASDVNFEVAPRQGVGSRRDYSVHCTDHKWRSIFVPHLGFDLIMYCFPI